MQNFHPFPAGSPNKWVASLLSLSLSLSLVCITHTLSAKSVLTCNTAYVTYSVSPYQDYFKASLRSVKEEAAGIKELKVWPNPTTGQLQVLLPGDHDAYRLELLDIYGRRVWMDRISQEGLRTVDFSSYPAGQYWLQARTVDGKVFSQLIMIAR